MTDQPLSPAAHAVWHAYETVNCDPYFIDPRQAGVAAALRAAADQVVPEEVRVRKGMRPGGIGSTTPTEWMQDQRLHSRRHLLAIAAELDGTTTPTES
jgi:hypothetical protein